MADLVPSIGVHRSARGRHKAHSRFSHYEGGWDKLVALVGKAYRLDQHYPGRHPGSCVVVLMECDGFYCRDGAELSLSEMFKLPARSVEVVLYECGLLGSKATTENDFEIVSLHAWPVPRHHEFTGRTPTAPLGDDSLSPRRSAAGRFE